MDPFQMIKDLGPPNDSKKFLASLKKVLEAVTSSHVTVKVADILPSLVSVYLDCPAKIPAKRILASFFQSLGGSCREAIEKMMAQSVLARLCVAGDVEVRQVRHCVDTITALLENFTIGEKCLNCIATEVIHFLVEAEDLFLSQVHEDVPPVHLNEVMHHCHVTVQTLNLVIQKTAAEATNQIISSGKLMGTMLDFDMKILHNEIFLLDCRCCCAMNAIILLQMAFPGPASFHQIPYLLMPGSVSDPTEQEVGWLTQAHIDSLAMERSSTLSFLALAYGYIAMVTPQAVVYEAKDGQQFYIETFLPHLLDHCKNASIEEQKPSSSLSLKLNGESKGLKSLLDYVWTHWEDQLDIIRQSAKTVFENVLKVHLFVTSSSVRCDGFIHSILSHLLAVSWTSKGKFSALTCCVRLIGAGEILAIQSGLSGEILKQLEEQALSCYASELYSTLFSTHQKELEAVDASDSYKHKLFQTWIDPVVEALCSSRQKQKQNIIEYLLPKLLKHGDHILNYMISRLSVHNTDQDETCYGAIIMCLRRARALGLLKTQVDKGSLWCGQLHPDVLKAALCSLDQQVRLDAFALLCENNRTTESITSFEFNMLKFFIPSNLNNQSPAFRQAFLALLKKFFSRMKESLTTLRRLDKKDKNATSVKESILEYEKFLTWLTNHLVGCLYPGSAFARRTTTLAVLSLMVALFKQEEDGLSVPKVLNRQHVQALVECLVDTFEENKKEALNILSAYIKQCAPVWDTSELKKIIKISMSLACSTKPQDCDTAVYNFLLILKHEEFKPESLDFSELLPLKVLRMSDVTTVSCVNKPLFLLEILLKLLDDEILVAKQSLITAAATRPMYPTLHCIRYILQEVDFSTLGPNVTPVAKSFLSQLINSCLNVSKVVSPVVQNSSPEGNVPEDALLSFDLPEENIRMSSTGEACGQVPGETLVSSRELVESMPEYLVVCCWRSIKEVSLTLGKMCLQMPAAMIAADGQGLLSLDQVKVVGEYFTQQLLESIHRGAFELAYAGFQLMCQMLWSHPASAFHKLPAQWLSHVMEDIKSGDPDSRFCATRRSAGVPFFVQAIVSTEPLATGRKCFHEVMRELLDLAISPAPGGHTAVNGQIHSLNILRTLYRETRLGEDVLPYVADGLKAAILGFKSELWAVRNCATLLLSALMTRIFGVKRSKDETAMSKKNCQTGRSFFHRYPSLYPFLLSELEEATASIGSRDRIHLHPSLYPVLLVLGRLFPSTLEGSDTNLSLGAFIPFVIRCASSPVYKTRVIASRALQPLARKNQVTSISLELLANLPESPSLCAVSNSLIHGSLLQLHQLVKLVKGLGSSLQEDFLHTVTPKLAQCSWLLSSENVCFATQQAALVLVDAVLDIEATYNRKSQNQLRLHFLSALLQARVISPEHQWRPLFYEAEKTRARLCLKYLPQIADTQAGHLNSDQQPVSSAGQSTVRPVVDVFLHGLQSPVYEVRLEVLNSLIQLHNTGGRAEAHNTGGRAEAYNTGGRAEAHNIGGRAEPHNTGGWAEAHLTEASGEDGVSTGDEVEPLIEGATGCRTEDIVAQLFDHLLDMGLELENHHECQEKVFYVLSSTPKCVQILSQKVPADLYQMLQRLLDCMSKERRPEVRAAMLRFTGQLISAVFQKMSATDVRSHGLELVREWASMVKSFSVLDDYPDLQMSCCYVLLWNTNTIMLDPNNTLGDISLTCWDSLASLLQEDDLDVKDMAASVLCALQGSGKPFHPSYALCQLPDVLLSVYKTKNLPAAVQCLLTWILDDSSVDVTESNERLFDKGEVNTYQDKISFTRIVCQSIVKLIGAHIKGSHYRLLHLTEETNENHLTQNGPSLTLADCMKEDQFREYINERVLSLSNGLERLSEVCAENDLYVNCSRYMLLCHSVFQAHVLLVVCNLLTDPGHSGQLVPVIDCTRLEKVVNEVILAFNLNNVISS
ncbi:thyroid adenoma-associated protein homolog [Physella acuta]|uniref:thyroid adenoma-associated protein homolog n=1 Tax=Physella acuta TaxID=109671 RepID=UPI0027DD8A2B|nr:thyroid adenoma-associated protein homolog [Physella acuta]